MECSSTHAKPKHVGFQVQPSSKKPPVVPRLNLDVTTEQTSNGIKKNAKHIKRKQEQLDTRPLNTESHAVERMLVHCLSHALYLTKAAFTILERKSIIIQSVGERHITASFIGAKRWVKESDPKLVKSYDIYIIRGIVNIKKTPSSWEKYNHSISKYREIILQGNFATIDDNEVEVNLQKLDEFSEKFYTFLTNAMCFSLRKIYFASSRKAFVTYADALMTVEEIPYTCFSREELVKDSKNQYKNLKQAKLIQKIALFIVHHSAEYLRKAGDLDTVRAFFKPKKIYYLRKNYSGNSSPEDKLEQSLENTLKRIDRQELKKLNVRS